MDALRVSDLARETGVKTSTIRYYERRGLLREPPRTGSSYVHGGYRLYSESDAARVRFIQNAQTLGFTLEEIHDLLTLRVDERTTCSDVKSRALAKLEEVDRRLRDLRRVRVALRHLVDACQDKGPQEECPILDALKQFPPKTDQ